MDWYIVVHCTLISSISSVVMSSFRVILLQKSRSAYIYVRAEMGTGVGFKCKM